MTELTLEDVYDALAAGIDAAGPGAETVYLAKTCLALAQALGDPARAIAIAHACGEDLTP